MATGESSADVRAWAREQGLQVGDRGRLPTRLVEQYDAAHPRAAAKTVKRSQGSPVAKRMSKPTPADRVVRQTLRRPPAPEIQSSVPEATPAPVEGGTQSDELLRDLDLVRQEVAELRKHLDEVLARVVDLEQPRGLFNRSRSRR